MNHVYGNGEAPPEHNYEMHRDDIVLPAFYSEHPSQTVEAEVLVEYEHGIEDAISARVVSVRYEDKDVTNLVLSGWEEYEIIDLVMGKGFVETML